MPLKFIYPISNYSISSLPTYLFLKYIASKCTSNFYQEFIYFILNIEFIQNF